MKMSIWIAAAMMTVALAACGPAGKTIGKTIGGQRTYNTEWREIDPGRVLIDFGRLDGAAITRTEERTRDNAIVQQRVYFDGRGFVYLEHLLGPFAVYNIRVTDRHNDMPKLADKYLARFDIQTADMEKGRIHKYGSRGGWVGRATEKGTGADCIVSRVAFLSRADKNWGTDERYDTVVSFHDCSGQRSVEEVREFLNGLRIVSRA